MARGGGGERLSGGLRNIFFWGGWVEKFFGGWEFEKFSRVGVEKFKGGGGGWSRPANNHTFRNKLYNVNMSTNAVPN